MIRPTICLPSLAGVVLAFAAHGYAQTKPATRPAPASAADFAQSLKTAKPGDVVTTAFAKLDESLPPLALKITPSANAARLVFSDRPEYFRAGDGIASQDEVSPGRVRFYTYHVPVIPDGKPRRVLTLIENTGKADATLRFNSHSEPAIGGDYNAIAKEAMAALLSDTGKGDVVKIKAGGHEISDRVEPTSKPDLLVHGLYDFTSDQPLRITVAQVTATDKIDDDVAKIATLPKIPMLPYGVATDKSGRGLFPVADFDVALDNTYDTASGPAQILVADGKRDPWIEGVDGISGDKTTDKGNYGVVYHMKLKWKSTDGRGIAVMLTSARFEKEFCGLVAAVVRVNNGKHPGGVISLPRETVRFHGVPEACVIQTFDPPANGAEATIELDYTPPGACCLPTPILIVPLERAAP